MCDCLLVNYAYFMWPDLRKLVLLLQGPTVSCDLYKLMKEYMSSTNIKGSELAKTKEINTTCLMPQDL